MKFILKCRAISCLKLMSVIPPPPPIPPALQILLPCGPAWQDAKLLKHGRSRRQETAES